MLSIPDIEMINTLLSDAVYKGVFPGCACAIVHDGHTSIVTKGNYTFAPDSKSVDTTAIYDVASITKAIPVSSLALKLVETGLVTVDDLLITHLPEFTGKYRELITIRHLLTQTLHFDFRLSTCSGLSSEEILKRILTADLASVPGSSFNYANATSILLGLVIERVSGKNLEQCGSEYFFDPLEMHSTSFYPYKLRNENIVPSEIAPGGHQICGEVHDESARALRPLVVGSAGLFSTIVDLSHFLEMLVNDGVWMGRRFFDESTMTQMSSNQLTGDFGDDQTGLGWELNQKTSMGIYKGIDVYGKTGFTGCSIAVCREKKCGYVLLSNHIFPKRRESRDSINAVRRALLHTLLIA
ncbi:MAG: serine hydrolase domain-containing protein [Fibrobacterota bacterium]|nr:serine hydrolase domain-containing protein [Chitinispirillaceae bacterium]